MEIWVNPECSKCQSALTMLNAGGADYTIRYYLEQPPTAEELTDVLVRLGLEPWEITRFGEPVAQNLGLASWPRNEDSRPRWIKALTENPTLIQRPIITADDGTATVARSPEAIRAIMPAPGERDR
ncbi:MAG TPA: ArsC/Spx/MgsR family protein [Actinophytocola sp.]|uniref:ArsC/Spx/MgsR family protein n=1 Tax=Actinophytocola sp. TaxID=1872138 RepID=UPI002DBA3A58|nr:ArsC/Spx/MgsR family protein [Actinophytocola sp.]HEU5473604.1 ArsC/Spx/MgsR family protein [Actinophytocola sp.]